MMWKVASRRSVRRNVAALDGSKPPRRVDQSAADQCQLIFSFFCVQLFFGLVAA
jgi:hypothetical protein